MGHPNLPYLSAMSYFCTDHDRQYSAHVKKERHSVDLCMEVFRSVAESA